MNNISLINVILIVLGCSLVLLNYMYFYFKNKSLISNQDSLNKKLGFFKINEERAVWEWNLKQDTVKMNDNCYKLIGFDTGEFGLRFENWLDRIHPDDRERVKETSLRILNPKTPLIEMSYRFLHENGEYITVQSRQSVIEYDQGETPIVIYGEYKDITLIQQYPSNQSTNSELMDELQNNARMGTFTLDQKNQNFNWSQMTYDIHSLNSKEDITLHSYLSYGFFDKKAQELITKTISQSFNTKEEFSIKYEVKIDDHLEWVKMSGRVKQTINNETLIIGTIQDINLEKSFERQFEIQKKHALEAANLAALGEIAGGIAHEINNPLSAIISNLMIIRKKIEIKGFDKDFLFGQLDKIGTTCNRIADIVIGMRNLSRNGSTEKKDVTNLKEIFKDVVSISNHKLKLNKINLELENENDIDQELFKCCRVQISQVFINLLNNSIDEIKDKKEDKWIKVKAYLRDDTLVVNFTDCGTEKIKDIKAIFQPFFTTKDIGNGTGLGLSLSRTIITAHGGQLFYNEKTANTTFTVEIPKNLEQRTELSA